MRRFLFILFLLTILALQANTLRVGQNQTYSSIQTAINTASAYDTVLVYPGTYAERLVVRQKALTIGSLYLITGDSLYASQTIIDPDFSGTCMQVFEAPYIKVAGFTFQHGLGEYNDMIETYGLGGIFFRLCNQFIFENNIVQYNTSGSGGGFSVLQSPGIISANVIRYNMTLARGTSGGLNISRNDNLGGYPIVILDPVRRNDVYFNTGYLATDIATSGYNEFYFPLNRFTVPQLSENFLRMDIGDNPFIDEQTFNYTYDIRQGMIEEVNADLYVSTTGNDNNNGLSPDHPLKTLFQAVLRVKGDSLHQSTVYVEPGIYTYEEGVSLLPLKLKSNTNLIGLNGSFTIDGANTYPIIKIFDSKNIKIENMNIINSEEKYHMSKMLIRGDNVELKNIRITNNPNIARSGTQLEIQAHRGIKLDQLYFYGTDSGLGITIQYKNPIRISNVYLNGFARQGLCVNVSDDDQLVLPPVQISNLFIENTKNEEISALDHSRLITLLTLFGLNNQDVQPFILSNISLVNNNTNYSVGSVYLQGPIDLKMYNSILYNHYANTIIHDLREGPQTALYKNCFFPEGDNSFFQIDGSPFECTKENLLSGDPLLYTWGGYSAMPRFDSPLVDAGTLALPEGFVLPETDLAGNPRISGNGIDIGAFERQPFMNNEETQIVEIPIKANFYPNPFYGVNAHKGSFQINLNIKGNSELAIYNIKGQKVRTLLKGYRDKGESLIYWDAKDDQGNQLPSGVYVYKLTCNGHETGDKFTIIK